MKRSDAAVTDVDKFGDGREGQAKRVLKYQNSPNSFPQKDLPFCVEVNSWGKKCDRVLLLTCSFRWILQVHAVVPVLTQLGRENKPLFYRVSSKPRYLLPWLNLLNYEPSSPQPTLRA